MISKIQDMTEAFNNGGAGFNMDISGWENVSVELVNLSGTVSFFGSNDANAIIAVSDGNALSSTNYYDLAVATIDAPNTFVLTGSADNIYILNPIGPMRCKFIALGGTSLSADKVLVFLSKPY